MLLTGRSISAALAAILVLFVLSGCTGAQEEDMSPETLLSQAVKKGSELQASYKGESSVSVNGKEVYRGQTYYQGAEAAEVMSSGESKEMTSVLTSLLTLDQLMEQKKKAVIDSAASNDQYTVLKLTMDPKDMEQVIKQKMQLQFDQIKQKYRIETMNLANTKAAELAEQQLHFKKTLDSLAVKGAQYILWIERGTHVPAKVSVDTTVNYDWNGQKQREQLKGSYTLQNKKAQ